MIIKWVGSNQIHAIQIDPKTIYLLYRLYKLTEISPKHNEGLSYVGKS